MRAGEGTRLGGFDGIVYSDNAHSFVPTGTSVWEMGVTDKVSSKAEEDFAKRTVNPLTAHPAETTFMFVTPRRWSGKEDWEKKKRDQGVWKDVRVLDADDLEAWLSVAPAVEAWLAPLLGKLSDGVTGIERFWEEWAGVTTPALVPAVVTSGWAGTPEAHLRAFLEGPAGALGVTSESKQVSAAFLAGALVAWDGEVGESLRARTLVVEDDRVWNSAVNQDSPSVLVPLFDGRDRVTAALRRGHHVLIPLGRREVGNGRVGNVIKLDRQKRRDLHAALSSMAFGQDRLDALATLGRRSLTALRRRLAHVGAVHRPDWANAEHLIAPMFAGAWQGDNEADQQMLARLAGRPYDEVERDVLSFADQDDPPLRHTGRVWQVTSKEDVWQLVSRILTREDLRRFTETTKEVLGTLDPADELPPEQRPYASLFGKARPHSGILREDLADTLALMGARSDEVGWHLEEDAQSFVDGVVAALLSAPTAQAWSSMSWVLPRLAEAAPNVFLTAIERAFETDQPPLVELFQDREHQLFGPSSPHTALLWALELLAWSPDYLLRAGMALARLAQLDPGGKLGNRPTESLLQIFKSWYRNTNTGAGDKLRALDAIRERAPNVAWPLLMALLPTGHDHASPTDEPKWRDWGQEQERGVLLTDRDTYLAGVVERLLTDVQGDVKRGVALLQEYQILTDEQRETLRHVIAEAAKAADDAERNRAWEALRHFVAHQKDFLGAKWALAEEDLRELEALSDGLAPSDAVALYRWLFGRAPALGVRHKSINHEKRYELLQQDRLQAVSEILQAEGSAGIERLLDALDEPNLAYGVGLAVGQQSDTAFEESATLHSFMRRGVTGPGFVNGVLQAWHARKGLDQVEKLLTSSALREWSPEDQASVMRMLPGWSRTWRLVNELGPEVENAYWDQLPSYAVSEENAEELRESFDQFQKRDRLVEAFEIARHKGLYLRGDEWLTLLEDLPKIGAEAIMNLSHDLKETLDQLTERPDVDTLRLAQTAWGYLPLYRFERPPKALTKALLTEPNLFADMVAAAFPKPEAREALDEVASAQQERAFALLHSFRGIPGQQDDGSIDGTTLRAWIDQARRRLQELDRAGIGDSQLGELLASSQPTPDGVWPAPEVCDVVEAVKSASLDDGLRVGRYNLRGVTSRALDEGGEQERALADRYRKNAATLEGRWPRTASILRELAQGYAAEARRNDDDADLTQDRWR